MNNENDNDIPISEEVLKILETIREQSKEGTYDDFKKNVEIYLSSLQSTMVQIKQYIRKTTPIPTTTPTPIPNTSPKHNTSSSSYKNRVHDETKKYYQKPKAKNQNAKTRSHKLKKSK